MWDKKRIESDIESRILRMTLQEFGVSTSLLTESDEIIRLYGKLIELYGDARVTETKNRLLNRYNNLR